MSEWQNVSERRNLLEWQNVSERRNLFEWQNVSERQKRVATHPLFREVYDLNNIFELLSWNFCSNSSFFFFCLSLCIFYIFIIIILFLMFIISLTCVLVTYLRFPLSPSLSPPPIASKTSVNQRRPQRVVRCTLSPCAVLCQVCDQCFCLIFWHHVGCVVFSILSIAIFCCVLQTLCCILQLTNFIILQTL